MSTDDPFSAVNASFTTDTDAQGVMRATHDAFRTTVAGQTGASDARKRERDGTAVASEKSPLPETPGAELSRWHAAVNGHSDALKTYAKAQHQLADGLWQSAEVDYVFDTLRQYFHFPAQAAAAEASGDVVKPSRVCLGGATELRRRVAAHKAENDGAPMPPDLHAATVQEVNALFTPADGVAKVLDVGSCYNPFGRDERGRGWLDVTAVDLEPSPNAPDVLRCDWMAASFAEEGVASAPGVVLARGYHAVVMSYLLTYLPTPSLRLRAVLHAVLAARPGAAIVIVDARRGGHRLTGWPHRFSRAFEAALGLQRVRLDTMKKSVGLVFRVPAAVVDTHVPAVNAFLDGALDASSPGGDKLADLAKLLAYDQELASA